MADVGKTTGGSPWDEPLPEGAETKKPMPTIVGDLDVSKNIQQAQTAENQKPTELKLPTNTEEKVGAKVDVAAETPVITPAQPIATSAPNANPSPQVAPKAPEANSDFWQSIYGQTASAPVPTETLVPKPTQPAQPKPLAPIVPTAVTNIINQPQPVASAPATTPQVPIRPTTQQPVSQPSAPLPKADNLVAPNQKTANNRIKTFIIAGVVGVVILFTGGVFLTEKGIISIGLEKIYGAIHLDAIWGGLPANAENAFAMSALKMKTEKGYKISGNATITVNKGVKSDLISPIVSTAGNQTSIDSQSTATESSGLSTVEELTTEINAQITDSVSGVDINIKSSENSNSKIQLVYSSDKMYLKTSDDIVYGSQTKGSWASLDFNKFGNDNPGQSFLGSQFSGSDFSIVGSRGTEETINGVRCFHYTGVATIGNALQNFGLSNDSISSLNMDYWLGTNDHFIRRLTMRIIPGSKSAVSRIDMTLDFSDFGNNSSDFIIPATSTPFSASASTSSTVGARDNQRKTDLANIAKALESYHTANGEYPQATGTEKISPTSGTLFSSLVPTYLSTLPLDPNDPTNYYGYVSDGASYTLSSVLEDKTDTSGKQVGANYLYFLSSL